MPQPVLGMGLTRDGDVVVESSIPEGSRGPIPNGLLYPFVMAGKLMANFPPAEVRGMARAAESRAAGLVGREARSACLFGCLSSGHGWASSGARGQKWIRAQFFDLPDGMLACTTKVPMFGGGDELHRACVDACLDYARYETLGSSIDALEGARTFFDLFSSNSISNPGQAVFFAHIAAMTAAGLVPGE